MNTIVNGYLLYTVLGWRRMGFVLDFFSLWSIFSDSLWYVCKCRQKIDKDRNQICFSELLYVFFSVFPSVSLRCLHFHLCIPVDVNDFLTVLWFSSLSPSVCLFLKICYNLVFIITCNHLHLMWRCFAFFEYIAWAGKLLWGSEAVHLCILKDRCLKLGSAGVCSTKVTSKGLFGPFMIQHFLKSPV